MLIGDFLLLGLLSALDPRGRTNRVSSAGTMSGLSQILRRATLRSLELIILQFLVVVIMPNNEVGTPDLPAVGAKKVTTATGCRPVSPSKARPATASRRVRQKRPVSIDCRPPELRLADVPRAAASQLSQHLRI